MEIRFARRTFLHAIAAQLAVASADSSWFRASAAEPTAARHPFSWDRVPVYVDTGKSSGFTHEEAQFLATHYSFLSLEKGQGIEPYGSTEAGAAAAIKQLKEINPRIKVLFYWNSVLDYVNLYKATRGGLPDTFFLKRLNGKPYDVRPGVRPYDLSNPAMRAWWLENAIKNVEDGNFDGIFVDAIPQIADGASRLAKLVGPQKAMALQAGLSRMLKELQMRLGSTKIILFNGLRFDPDGWKDGGLSFLRDTSGAMIEHFGFRASATPERMAGDIELARACARRGKITIFKGWPTFNWLDNQEVLHQPHDVIHARAAHDITFPLACFLVAAGVYSYFDYSWGYRLDMGALDWYPEFQKPLGPPRNEAIRHQYTYHREFAHASVYVNLMRKQAKITWRG